MLFVNYVLADPPNVTTAAHAWGPCPGVAMYNKLVFARLCSIRIMRRISTGQRTGLEKSPYRDIPPSLSGCS